MTGPEVATTRRFLLELLGIPRLPDDELGMLAERADWPRVLELASPSLHPMLAARLEQRRIDAPVAVRDQLQRARWASAVTLTRRRAETRRALDALERAGISPTVLKGFALAHLVYPSPESRTMSDVDLWIHADTLGPAMAALEPLGWRVPADAAPSPAGPGGQVGLVLPSAKLIIELHRDPGSLVATAPGALDEIWARRMRAGLGGVTAWILPAEETLMHLSVHLAEHHRFLDAIGRLLDLSLVVQTFAVAIDWPAFAARCRGLHIEGWVATSLGTARDLLGAPVTAEQLAGFKVPDLDRICAAAAEQAWLRPTCAQGPQAILSAPTPHAMAQRLQRRLAYVFRDVEADAATPSLRPRQRLGRLRVVAQRYLPGFLRTLWLNVVRPAAGAQLRRHGSENEALAAAMRGRTISDGHG